MLVADRDRRAREAEELRVSIAEIEAIAPSRGEDSALAERSDRLTNVEDLRFAAAESHELLSSDSPEDARDAIGLLGMARRSLERVAEHDPELASIADALAEASLAVNDVSSRLASYLGSLDTDSAQELESVQERRAELGALVRKYGPTLDDAIDFLDSGSARLLELDSDSTRIDALGTEVQRDRDNVMALAEAITARRQEAASALSARVSEELGALAMPDARLVITVEDRQDYSLLGKDLVSFLLAPHPGAEPRPLGRGASGGELSRVMLAIEVVLAGADPVPTFIFDEIDAGVGGASAIEVGRRLAELSATAQVIVVTHLAQVAAFATNHLRVLKDRDGAVTESSVEQLSGDERLSEMARLLSGLPDSESGLAHARELLDLAAQKR